jgi:hypothetical protein
LIDPQEAFGALSSSLAPLLRAAGFAPSDEPSNRQGPDLLIANFDRGDHEIRLVWDAKESAYILEARPQSMRQFPHAWIDLSLQRFDREQADSQWVAEILAGLEEHLGKYLQAPLS